MSEKDKQALSIDYLDRYTAIRDTAEQMAWDIGNHLGAVVNAICDVFDAEHPMTIYFDGAEEGDIGSPDISGPCVPYVFYNDGSPVNLRTSKCNYEFEVPIEFMYMHADEAKEIVKKEIEEDRKAKEVKKDKRSKANKEKEIALKAAKEKLKAAKLTKAELKALGL